MNDEYHGTEDGNNRNRENYESSEYIDMKAKDQEKIWDCNNLNSEYHVMSEYIDMKAKNQETARDGNSMNCEYSERKAMERPMGRLRRHNP